MKYTFNGFFIRLVSVVLLSITFCLPIYGQTTSSDATSENSVELLKVVWVYKFLNYIEWPNEKKLNTITISYWGNDSDFYQNLLALNGKDVRASRIRIVKQNNINPEANVQVIVVGKNNNRSLAKLQSNLSGKNTLIISDNATNKQNIMINFVYPDVNSISFELNRYNIIYEKLSLSADILVIGGTEVDIAKVLNEMNTKLDDTKVLLDKREKTLTALSSEITEKENKMLSLQEKIYKQTRDINKRQKQSIILKEEMDELVSILEKSYNELTVSYEELAINNKALDDKQKQLTSKEAGIKKLSQAISANELTLTEQIKHIDEQKKTLANQEEALAIQEKELLNKTSTIERQNTAMIIILPFVFLVLVIVFVLFKSSQNKKKSYEVLSSKNTKLAEINDELIQTQSQLVESEKMAALGGLVAGVAHEINTPIGVSVTAISTSQHLIDKFTASLKENKVTRSGMDEFISKLNLATGLINTNLIRANDLIRQFKLVAVDQSSEEKRDFLLGEYLKEVLSSLYPQYKKYQCEIDISCDAKLSIHTYPGRVAQIITNLVVNTVLHGFETDKKGAIKLSVSEEDKNVIITYEDNGIGIASDKHSQIFTPFYTTKRNTGGSGLGLHICYNIASNLGGEIKCVPCETGAKFVITLLKKL